MRTAFFVRVNGFESVDIGWTKVAERKKESTDKDGIAAVTLPRAEWPVANKLRTSD
jgi:hypothetical protein